MAIGSEAVYILPHPGTSHTISCIVDVTKKYSKSTIFTSNTLSRDPNFYPHTCNMMAASSSPAPTYRALTLRAYLAEWSLNLITCVFDAPAGYNEVRAKVSKLLPGGLNTEEKKAIDKR
ncbi:unnamed protein product, partial [Amoebophrya sp. A25]|eukprot:GSA25T00015974001.1